jgi:Bacterial Ig-like domain (group 3)/FG-GAP-like repeat
VRRSLVLLATLLMAGLSLPLHAQSPLATITTLAVGPSTSVPFEQPVTLTATIVDSNNSPVLHGTVTFYDGMTVLGTRTIVSSSSGGHTPGTSFLVTRSLAQTTHSLTAKFLGTTSDLTSTSGAQTVTITATAGPYPSGTLLTPTGSSNGNYGLTATVGGFGPFAPTGSVTLNDTTTGSSLGTLTLAPSSTDFLISTAIPDSPPGTCASVVATGDFNNDGNLDVVAVNGADTFGACGDSSGSLVTMLGSGDGTFTTGPVLSNSFSNGFQSGGNPNLPMQAVVADFNGDGNLDLAVICGNTFYLFFGNGDGSFQSALMPLGAPAAGNNSASVAAIAEADFNNDGIPDLAIPQNDTPAGTYVLLGNGDGTFAVSTLPYEGNAVATGDITGDGNADIVLAGGESVILFPGNGDGTFGSPVIANFMYDNSFGGVAVANLAGSGPAQILFPLVAGPGGSAALAVVSYSSGSLIQTTYTISQNETRPLWVASGDYNYDGNLDVAVYDEYQGILSIFYGNGDGTLQATPNQIPLTGNTVGTASLASGDFLNDGNADLALSDATTGNIDLLQPAFTASASLNGQTVCGQQMVQAAYPGDTNFIASTSPSVTLGAGVAPTETITGIPATAPTGVPFTATVTMGPTCAQGNPPTGTVAMLDFGNINQGQGTLSGNPASTSITLNTATQPMWVGTEALTASYDGDAFWSPSSATSSSIIITGTTALSMSYSGASTVTSGSPITITGQLTANQAGNPPTGTVTLLDNGKAIGSVTLSGISPISLTFTANTTGQPFTAGSNALSLSYSGDTNWGASTSNSVTVTATIADSVTLTSNLPTSLLAVQGATVQFTTTVTPLGSSTTPTGTVQFYDVTTPIGAPVTLVSGTASYSSSSFAVGPHSITAAYSGNSTYASQTSAAIAFTMTATGTTAVTLNPPPNVFQGATFTVVATVAASPQRLGPTPTGTVTLSNNGTAVGTAPLSANGTASFTLNPATSPFVLGANSLTASYSGNSQWNASTSVQYSYQIAQGVTSLGGLTCSAARGYFPASTISCTATFQANWGNYPVPPPPGLVSLLVNGQPVGGEAIPDFPPGSDGVHFALTAQFQINTSAEPLAAGSYALTMSYPGGGGWQSATSNAVNITITPPVPTFSLTSSLGTYGSAVEGTPVTFTATAVGNGAGVPTGTVQFYINSAAAGSPVTMASGVATLTASSLGSGQNNITAAYSGNTYYNATTTNGVVVVVPQGPDVLAITLSGPATVSLGTPVTVNGTLTVGAYGPAPTGSVTLLDGTTGIGTAALSGKAPFALAFNVNTASSPLAVGSHSFSLKYAGTTQWAASASSTAAVSVTQAASTTAVTSSAATANAGVSVTFTATVSSTVTSPAPTGTVQFYDGTTALGSAITLASNAAIYTTTSLTGGTHSITAVYSGDANFATSTSTAFTQTIQGITLTNTAVTGTVSPGQSASYTLTVTSEGGLNESTSFACTGVPKGAACSVSPQTVTGSGSTTLTITTTGSSAASVPNPLKLWTARGAPVLACVVLLLAPARRRKQLLFLVLLAVIPALTVGCGGGGGGGCGTNCGGGINTPAGTYTITVTSTTGSGTSAITATTTVTLTVQ